MGALIIGFVLLGTGILLVIPPAAFDPLAKTVWENFRWGRMALTLNTEDAAFAFDIGNRAFGLEFYDASLAQRAFRETIEIEPGILNAHYQLARVLFVEGKFEEALTAINKELQYHPNNLRSLYVRGLIYAYTDRLALAEADFKKFVAWVPTEWAGYNDLAWVLGQEGKYREAKEVMILAFTKAHGAETNPWLWNTLGVQELNLGEYTLATNSFERAEALAATLDEKTWRAAYPGNNPSTTSDGLAEFRRAIDTNLAKVRSGTQ